jgi:hypothetical protein
MSKAINSQSAYHRTGVVMSLDKLTAHCLFMLLAEAPKIPPT